MGTDYYGRLVQMVLPVFVTEDREDSECCVSIAHTCTHTMIQM